jgi:hypothetical protein
VFPVHPPHITWKREQQQIVAKSPKKYGRNNYATIHILNKCETRRE